MKNIIKESNRRTCTPFLLFSIWFSIFIFLYLFCCCPLFVHPRFQLTHYKSIFSPLLEFWFWGICLSDFSLHPRWKEFHLHCSEKQSDKFLSQNKCVFFLWMTLIGLSVNSFLFLQWELSAFTMLTDRSLAKSFLSFFRSGECVWLRFFKFCVLSNMLLCQALISVSHHVRYLNMEFCPLMDIFIILWLNSFMF